ncbi:MAG: hypothetical protein P4L16_00570 [Chlamydiales bacterium]|nr:hypothetical protein [Chlamydiales bacterium]
MKYVFGFFAFIFMSNLYGYSFRECEPNRLFIAPVYKSNKWIFEDVPRENLWGGMIGFEHLRENDIFARVIGAEASGKTGSLWFDHFWNVEGEVGYTWGCNGFFATPYVGVGFIYDQEPNFDSVIWKEFSYYLPFGLLLGYDFSCDWTLMLRSQGNYIFSNRVTRGNTPFSATNVTFWLFELPVTWRFYSNLDLSFVPTYSYTPQMDLSGSDGLTWANQSTWGGRIELGYRW